MLLLNVVTNNRRFIWLISVSCFSGKCFPDGFGTTIQKPTGSRGGGCCCASSSPDPQRCCDLEPNLRLWLCSLDQADNSTDSLSAQPTASQSASSSTHTSAGWSGRKRITSICWEAPSLSCSCRTGCSWSSGGPSVEQPASQDQLVNPLNHPVQPMICWFGLG